MASRGVWAGMRYAILLLLLLRCVQDRISNGSSTASLGEGARSLYIRVISVTEDACNVARSMSVTGSKSSGLMSACFSEIRLYLHTLCSHDEMQTGSNRS